jgi:AcrR family transcriptional regulator
MGAKKTTKRRPRALVRGEPVVHGVLHAAMQELARVGYEALRIDDVAVLAKVNKTTIYRRWPTKADLISCALRSDTVEEMAPPATGSLRGDLLAIAGRMVSAMCAPEKMAIVRVIIAEGPDSELWTIARRLHEGFQAVRDAVIDAAVLRGELSPGTDGVLLLEAFVASVRQKLFFMRETADQAYLERLVDLLLRGALSPAGRARPRPPAPSEPAPSAPPRRARSSRRS